MIECCMIDNKDIKEIRATWESFQTTYPDHEGIMRDWRENLVECRDIPQEEADKIPDSDIYDSDAYEWAWEDFLEELNAALLLIDVEETELFAVTSGAVGWTRGAGGKIVGTYGEKKAGAHLLHEVLGALDCTIAMYYSKENGSLSMTVSSHDSPMGDCYQIEAAKYQCAECESWGFLVDEHPDELVERMDWESRLHKKDDGYLCDCCLESLEEAEEEENV